MWQLVFYSSTQAGLPTLILLIRKHAHSWYVYAIMSVCCVGFLSTYVVCLHYLKGYLAMSYCILEAILCMPTVLKNSYTHGGTPVC